MVGTIARRYAEARRRGWQLGATTSAGLVSVNSGETLQVRLIFDSYVSQNTQLLRFTPADFAAVNPNQLIGDIR